MTPTAERLARLDAHVAQEVAKYLLKGMTAQQCTELEAALRVDHVPEWMDYPDAQFIVMSLRLDPDCDAFTDDDIMSANRTSVTATNAERTGLVADRMGVSIDQAQKMCDAIRDGLPLPPEPSSGNELEDCALYRHYDHEGVLLYIGIAFNPEARRCQHEASSPWSRFSVDMEVEWFASRDDALEAERDAIADERPVFNRTHNKRNRDAIVAYLFKALSAVRS